MHVTEELARKVAARKLSEEQHRKIVGHLIDGCEDCIEKVQDVLADQWNERHAERQEEARAFDSLIEEMDAVPVAAQRQLATAKDRIPSRGFVDRLAAESYSSMHEDPDRAVRLAEIGVEVAANYAARVKDEPEGFDARAKALIQLANAHRRCRSDFARAENLLAEADVLQQQGTGDPYLRAERLRIFGLMRNEQTRCDEAKALVEDALRIYWSLGAKREFVVCYLSLSAVFAESDHFEEAVDALNKTLAFATEFDLRFALAVTHNLAGCHTELGNTETALALLDIAGRLCLEAGQRTDALRIEWTQAKLFADSKMIEESSKTFRRARDGFLSMGLSFEASHVALDHAAVLMELGRLVELQQQSKESYELFRSRGLHAEALAAMGYFTEAVAKDRANAEILAYVYRFVHSVQSDPTLKFRRPRTSIRFGPWR